MNPSAIYEQSTGLLKDPTGRILVHCYSGVSRGKNCPDFQDVPDVGPIPVGCYTAGEPEYTKPGETSEHGPYVIPLTPDPANQMHGRGGFLLHADAVHRPGTASRGCIVTVSGKVTGDVVLFGRALREALHTYLASTGNRIQVITGPWPVAGVGSSQGQDVPT